MAEQQFEAEQSGDMSVEQLLAAQGKPSPEKKKEEEKTGEEVEEKTEARTSRD